VASGSICLIGSSSARSSSPISRRLQEWVKSEPSAPDGDWYKDFDSFNLRGSNQYPKTILTNGMTAFGKRIV